MLIRIYFSLTLMVFVLCLAACNDFNSWFAMEFRRGDVVSGIARLSAQHLSMITNELSKKFKEDTVPVEIIESPDPQELGKGFVKKTIENVDLGYETESTIHEDCTGNKAVWRGHVHVVKATQTMYGRLTNNKDNPIIPDPNGVKLSIHVRANNSIIRFPKKDSHIEINSGEIAFSVIPRLAQTQKNDSTKYLRVIPTSNVRFENVVMKDVKGKLVSLKVTLPFDISDSDYMIQIGAGENGEENKIDGEMTAFGQKRKIPVDGKHLDPKYDPNEFVRGFSCKEELKGVVQYNNVLFEEKIGPAMAALTTLVMGKVASKLSDDYHCGMSSPDFLRDTMIEGAPGKTGKASASLNGSCKVHFQNYQTAPDCFGVAHVINGEAVVTKATKRMQGVIFYPQGDFRNLVDNYERDIRNDTAAALLAKPEAALPNSRQPVVIDLSADLSNLTITETCIGQGSLNHMGHCSKKNLQPVTFSIKGGEVSARIKPVMGKSVDPADEHFKMCAVRNIPIAQAELSLNHVQASIKKANNEFTLLAHGSYRAVNGQIGDSENELSGELTINKILVPFKGSNSPYLPLKPDYERALFEDSFQSCMQTKFVVPKNDEDCSLKDVLGGA